MGLPKSSLESPEPKAQLPFSTCRSPISTLPISFTLSLHPLLFNSFSVLIECYLQTLAFFTPSHPHSSLYYPEPQSAAPPPPATFPPAQYSPGGSISRPRSRQLPTFTEVVFESDKTTSKLPQEAALRLKNGRGIERVI